MESVSVASAPPANKTQLGSPMNVEELTASIHQQFIQSGERDRCKALLRQRLVESGWRQKVKRAASDVIHARGIDNVSVLDCLEERARTLTMYVELVPEDARAELLSRIRTWLMRNVNETN